MSDDTQPINPDGSPPLPPPPPQARSACLTALMIVIGIILLLPGLCSLFFIFGGLIKTASDVQFAASLLALGALGVGLLGWVIWSGRTRSGG